MNFASTIGVLTIALFALCGAYFDIRERRLPNWLCLICFIAGIVYLSSAAGSPQALSAFAHAAIALGVGIALYAASLIGGGDAKFFAGMAAWFPLKLAFQLIFATALAGVILAVAVLLKRGRKATSAPPLDPENSDFNKVPFGVAIAIGGVVTFVLNYPL